MASAGQQGAGVVDEERLEEAEKNGDPGSFDPGLETGYLRRGPRDHSLDPDLGAAPFDPGEGTRYDRRRARRAAKKREKEERKRREREERLAREEAERDAEKQREADERRRGELEEKARKERERRRRESLTRARQEREERLKALREESREEDEDGGGVPTAREEYRRREALADRLRVEREEREREEAKRRARIEQEREERDGDDRERREERRRARWERWRRDHDKIEEERRERELRERRQRAKRARRPRRRRPTGRRPAGQGRKPATGAQPAAGAQPATGAQRRQRPAAPDRAPAAQPGAARRVRRISPEPTRQAPARVRRIKHPQPARPAQIRVRPTGRGLWRPTAIAGIAVAAVLSVVAAMGSLLGLPVPLVSGDSSATLAETSGLTLDAGTPSGLPRGPFFPLATEQPDFGEAAAKFGAKRSGHIHQGQDMFAPVGTPEVAVRDGIVLDGGGGKSFYSFGGGNTFVEYSPVDDRSYVYLHMLHPSPLHAGDQVHAGQQIGQLGCTGSCDGPHLHFEIRIGKVGYGKEGKAINPLPLLQQWLPTQSPSP